MDPLAELPSLDRRVAAGLGEAVRDVLRAEVAQARAREGGDKLLGPPDMSANGLILNALINNMFSVELQELLSPVGHCLLHHLHILASFRKRGFQGMPDQFGCAQLGGGDTWNRDVTKQADSV